MSRDPGVSKAWVGTLSEDGIHEWTGTEWIVRADKPTKTTQHFTVSAGTAFKIGFFGALGAMVAAAPFYLVVTLLTYHPAVP